MEKKLKKQEFLNLKTSLAKQEMLDVKNDPEMMDTISRTNDNINDIIVLFVEQREYVLNGSDIAYSNEDQLYIEMLKNSAKLFSQQHLQYRKFFINKNMPIMSAPVTSISLIAAAAGSSIKQIDDYIKAIHMLKNSAEAIEFLLLIKKEYTKLFDAAEYYMNSNWHDYKVKER